MLYRTWVVALICVATFAQNHPPVESTRARAQQEVGSGSGTSNPTSTLPDSTHLILTRQVPVFYPLSAEEQKLQGVVVAKLAIQENGDVQSVEPISGDTTLANSVAEALKEWKFKPFIKNGNPVRVSTKLSFDFIFCDKVVDKGSGVTNADGDPGGDIPEGSIIIVDLPESLNRKIVSHRVQPRYPDAAKLARVQGQVVLRVRVAKDGTVESLYLVSSDSPQLSQSALDAVKQWQYKPYFFRNAPTGFETSVKVTFSIM